MAESTQSARRPDGDAAAVEFLEALAPTDATVRRRAMMALLRAVTRKQDRP